MDFMDNNKKSYDKRGSHIITLKGQTFKFINHEKKIVIVIRKNNKKDPVPQMSFWTCQFKFIHFD